MIKLNGHSIVFNKLVDNTIQIAELPDSQLRYIKDSIVNEIYWKFEDLRELMSVLQLIDLIWTHNEEPHIILNCPYLPYWSSPNLATFIRTIGAAVISELSIFDCPNEDFLAHPSIPINIINNESPCSIINNIFNDNNVGCVVYLEQSDRTRYSSIQQLSAVPSSIIAECVSHTIPSGQSIMIVANYCDDNHIKSIESFIEGLGNQKPNVILYASHIVNENILKLALSSSISKFFHGAQINE